MNKVNYKRKAFRMLALGFPILYMLTSQVVTVVVVGVLLIAAIIFDVSRLRNKRLNQAVFRKISIMKEKEKGKISSITLILLGILLSVLLFPKGIAILAIAFTIVGDPLAEIIGSRYRRIKMLGKSLEGNIACLLGCVFIGLIFNIYLNVDNLVLIIGAFAATLVQALPLRIDDNLSMQLAAGLAMILIG